ncbi:MATE family efflux transporter [Bacteroides acidifaciens]|uniref:MATE family efflux transporter n=1 Tax=Bacteroides acidifaciens TaxID=85831 RepID=UPI002557FBFD|nr:MATE family efflux transporter [Bacteroides acidifaciens]
MKKRNLDRDKLDFADGKIGVLLRALFFPTLIGMVFNSALTMIDGIFVGKGVGADGIAAVNIVAPLFMICTGIGLMFGIGASVVASIRLSENNIKAARIIMTQALAVGVLFVGMICAGCLLFSRQFVYALGCSPLLEGKAISYLIWLLPGMIFLFIQCVGMMLIRLDGSPKYAMTIQIVAAIVNIGLDWYMIFPMGWGVMGAALATSIACVIAGMMALIYFLRFSSRLKFYRLKLSATSLLLTLRNAGYMIKIGFATFLTEVAMGVMMITGNYMFISLLGEEGVAAFAIACYLFPVVFSISNAVAQSAQPIISYNYGAHRPERVNSTLHLSLFTAIACGLSITACLCLGATEIARLFLHPQENAYGLAVKGLPLFSLCAMFFAVNIVFIGYYQSIEKAKASTAYTLLRGVLFLVPCFLLLPRTIGIPGLWLAIPAAELCACTVICVRYIQSNSTQKKKTV